jgi:hypothetical protein
MTELRGGIRTRASRLRRALYPRTVSLRPAEQGTAAVVLVQTGNCSTTELPGREGPGRESNPRPVDAESITGSVPARSRMCRRGRGVRSGRGVEPQTLSGLFPQITEPLRPATIVKGKPARSRTRSCEVGARRASGTPQVCEERTARLERASPEWRSGALPSELRPREQIRPAGVEPATAAVAGQRSVH